MDLNHSLPQSEANKLMKFLAEQCSHKKEFGFMSASVYDTAWVAMIQHPQNRDMSPWLFPGAFQYLLDKQLPSGGWESDTSHVDGILSTAAALLAMKKHLNLMEAHEEEHRAGVTDRCNRAELALKTLLRSWTIGEADRVGQELLVTKMLELLADQDFHVDFPARTDLRTLFDTKLSISNLECVYNSPTTLHHSLEAFVGQIDFDRVGRFRQENGSMMNSPASTAAYLMHSSIWDEEAEAYLKNALQQVDGVNKSSWPCAWPTSVFELSWVRYSWIRPVPLILILSGNHDTHGSRYPHSGRRPNDFQGLSKRCSREEWRHRWIW